MLADGIVRRAKQQVAPGIQADIFHPGKLQKDVVWVRAGLDDKVIFQLLLVAVVDQIHARIDVMIFHPGKHGRTRVPSGRIVAGKIIRPALHRVHPFNPGIGVRPGKFQADDLRITTFDVFLKREPCLAACEQKISVPAVGKKFNRGIRLSYVGLETDGQVCIFRHVTTARRKNTGPKTDVV